MIKRNLIFLLFVASILVITLSLLLRSEQKDFVEKKEIKAIKRQNLSEIKFALGFDPIKLKILKDLEKHLTEANQEWSDEEKEDVVKTLLEIEKKLGLNSNLFLKIMKVESNFKIDAISKDGAIGLCQIQPNTARFISLQTNNIPLPERMLFDPVLNLRLSAMYLEYLEKKYNSLPKAITAYNLGPGRYSLLFGNGGFVKTTYNLKLEKE